MIQCLLIYSACNLISANSAFINFQMLTKFPNNFLPLLYIQLEKENERLLEGRRIMSQKINEQIAAVQEEESKMKAVVDQL